MRLSTEITLANDTSKIKSARLKKNFWEQIF